MNRPVLRVLGTRGVPAAHGGFETFAERLALHLTSRGWRVVVYCQEKGPAGRREDVWNGIERVFIAVGGQGPASTMAFDWRAICHAASRRDLCLTLGYNTALFCVWLRARRTPNVINMDGIEWSRGKWGALARAWLWMNDWAGCCLADHLVADHPEIERHLATRVGAAKITTIAYGADRILPCGEDRVTALGLRPGRYLSVIARPEPENSILEMVQGFSLRRRGVDLAVLGDYSDSDPYHRRVRVAASDEVKFLGAIYDKDVVQALRSHSLAYVHGHQAGGSNPSLIEALGAGNAIIAHDNRFNRWVAGRDALYFDSVAGLASVLDEVVGNEELLERMRAGSRRRHETEFTWERILSRYETLLLGFQPETV